MSHPETRLPAAAAMAVLAMAGLGAQAADLRGERYAMVDPEAMQHAAAAVPAAAPKAPVARKTAKPGKAKILTGMQGYRTPAQRALERINRPAGACQPGNGTCPAVFPDGLAKSQSWRHAKAPQSFASERQQAGTPAQGEPALASPFAEIPGLVPGRESNYKFTFNVPVGRNENVQLQANLRRHAYNLDDSSDSTLRADWSIRF